MYVCLFVCLNVCMFVCLCVCGDKGNCLVLLKALTLTILQETLGHFEILLGQSWRFIHDNVDADC